MKKSVLVLMCLFLAGTTFTLKSQNMTQEEKNSYALGANVGESFRASKLDVTFDAFKEGFMDALKGENKFTMEEMQACFEDIQKKIEAKQKAEMDIEKERGRKFLAENKKRKGVNETSSGLQYEVIVMGTGAKPSTTDKVRVHYHGTTIDGEIFDSSVQRGEPIEFGLNQVIKGWTEGLQLMPIGSKYILYIPADLAYGEHSPSPMIKGGATLIFEVELLDIPK